MPPRLPITDVEVPPDAFPFLVVGVLEVMRRGEYDFDMDPLPTLRPATGRVGLAGADRDVAAFAVVEWLSARDVPATALPRA